MPLEKAQIFHIVGEIVVLVGMFVYFQMKTSSTSSKVQELEKIIQEQNQKIKILDAVLQEIVKIMPPQVRNNISHKVQMVQEVPQTPRVQQAVNEPNVSKPKPENPLASVMNMIAPMMSSMMVAGMGGDDPMESVNVVESSENNSEISDADIADELQDLEESPENVDAEIEEVAEDSKSPGEISPGNEDVDEDNEDVDEDNEDKNAEDK